MKTTDGRDIPNGICCKCKDQTACTCYFIVPAIQWWGMTTLDWEAERALANEGIADYARMLREIDEDE